HAARRAPVGPLQAPPPHHRIRSGRGSPPRTRRRLRRPRHEARPPRPTHRIDHRFETRWGAFGTGRPRGRSPFARPRRRERSPRSREESRMKKRAQVESVAEAYLELLASRRVEYFFGNAGTDFAPIVEAYAKRAPHGHVPPTPI